jgi:hypothetical protein
MIKYPEWFSFNKYHTQGEWAAFLLEKALITHFCMSQQPCETFSFVIDETKSVIMLKDKLCEYLRRLSQND